MNPFRWLFRWLGFALGWVWRKPLLAWVKVRTVPKPLRESLTLDPSKPVCYVLPLRSWADRVVLEQTCAEAGLPQPYKTRQRLPNSQRAAMLHLPALAEASLEAQKTELQTLIDAALEAQDYDLQLVPVSVFWGRDPGKETSLFKILFTDSASAGPLRKALIVLANGRNTLVSFGQPVSFKDFVAQETDAPSAMHKLARVLRVHFRRSRDAALGPSKSTRSSMVRAILQHPNVRREMAALESAEGISADKARAKARKYALEIAADYTMAPIRFMEVVLDWLFSRLFDGLDVHRIEQARQAAHEGVVVYLPSHRSHLDYLLLTYVLYKNGLAPPYIAAGINMNFWPVGGLLRRCGAFYLRRSFKGNKLYSAVFRAYVDSLVAKGTPIEFFPEGGRSRTGRLRRPMTGMLSMVVESALRNPDKPVKIVPVFLGYDRIMEVGSYFSELSGKSGKQKESALGLLKAGRKIKRAYGKPCIAFGDAIDLHEYLRARHDDWQQHDWQADARPDWWGGFVSDLAQSTMRGVNATAVIRPVAMSSLALLATPQRALAADELHDRIDAFCQLQRSAPYSGQISWGADDAETLLKLAEPVAGFTRLEHAWGDLLVAQDKTAVLLTYYRNSIQHVFALPSLVANFFSSRPRRTRQDVIDGCCALYPILRDELFLPWDDLQVPDAVAEQIDAMVRMGLLQADGDMLCRPDPSSDAYGHLGGLMRVMRESLERYGMTLVLLAARGGGGVIERKAFETECGLMAERMAVLTGRNAPEFFDTAIFRGHIESLLGAGFLRPAAPDGKLERLVIEPAVAELTTRSLSLLGPEVEQTVLHLTGRQRNELASAA